MAIVYADKIGFCMGVRRAVSILEEALDSGEDAPLATYGPLIHNPQVVASYETRGVRVVNKSDEVNAGDRVVIRAHGVPSQVLADLEARGGIIIDATCPKVAHSIKKARKAEARGRQVILVGDAGHGEMLAIAGSLENPASARVIADIDQALSIQLSGKVSVIAQTTFDKELYFQIAEKICERCKDCMVERSICPATSLRQDSVKKLAEEVQGIVVIGGRNSANTRRLYELAKSSGLPAWQVEGPGEVPEEVGRLSVVGISAGASTPDTSIQETAEKILELQGEK